MNITEARALSPGQKIKTPGGTFPFVKLVYSGSGMLDWIVVYKGFGGLEYYRPISEVELVDQKFKPMRAYRHRTNNKIYNVKFVDAGYAFGYVDDQKFPTVYGHEALNLNYEEA